MKYQRSLLTLLMTSLFATNAYSSNNLFENRNQVKTIKNSTKNPTRILKDLTIKEVIEIPLKDDRPEIGFNDLYKKSLKYNYDIQQMENKKLIIKEDIHMEKLGSFPSVDFVYNHYKSYKDYERFSNPYHTIQSTFSINTSLVIDAFGARQTKIDLLNHENKIGDLSICENKIATSLQLLDAYVVIQTSRASRIVLKKLILEHKKRFDMKTKLYEQGLLGATELITDKAALLSAINSLNTEDNRIEYYSTILKLKTGYEINSNIRIAPLIHNYNSIDKNYELNNIKTKIKNEKINKNKQEINFYKKSSLPTLELYYNNDFYTEDSDEASKHRNKRDYQVGFNLSWSLNSIFNYKSQKRRKLLESKNEEILYEKSKQNTDIELNRRFIEIKNYAVFKKVADEKVHILQDEIEKNTRMYDEGLEYKYKISDSRIKIHNEELDAIKRKFLNAAYKKYISIILEKDNICTLL